MTVFSNPSELVDPYPAIDDWINGGIARATSDIAIAAWTSERDTEPYVPMHLAAIRYTTAGPEIGPLVTIEFPTNMAVYDVVEGQDKQVWIVAGDITSTAIRLGLANVNIETLELTFQWKFGLPSYQRPGWGGVLPTSWPEQNLIILATNEGNPAHTDLGLPWVWLVDTTTGALVASIQTPLYDPDTTTNTTRVTTHSVALHKGTGRLLLYGDWYQASTGTYRPGLWTIEVTGAGFVGDWTKIADIEPVDSRTTYLTTRWAVTAATADGWVVLTLTTEIWNTAHWYHVGLDGAVASGGTIGGVTNLWNYYMRRPYDCAYDIAYDRSIGCCMSWGYWSYDVDPNGVYVPGGFKHLEATGAQVTAVQTLPGSEKNLNYVSMVNVAVVGPGRYVYLCASTDILRPRGSGYYDSFGQFTYVGGESVDISFRTGGQVDETQRAFHTVRTG